MLRSRLLEFYTNSLRDDMIMKFGRVVELKNLECSMVIPKQYSNKNDDRILAVSLLEVITGQKAVSVDCNPMWEDPRQMTLTSEERKEANRLRGLMLSENLRNKKNTKVHIKEAPKISSSEFKRANYATKIKTDLRKVNLFFLLDKLREFYLPEAVINSRTVEQENFETVSRRSNTSSTLSIPPRDQVKMNCKHVQEVTTTYILKASDLIKMPDIELHFQTLNPLLKDSGDQENRVKASVSKKGIDLILRPTLSFFYPLSAHKRRASENVDSLKMFNYVLSCFFNPVMERPQLKSP